MILKRIVVSNWRSLLNEVEVGPFSEGLNVIHAPNGTGKSSLFEAMRRGLFDAHHVSGSEISAIQPWGRDLTPSVTIDFIEGEDTWRVEKSFLSGKSAKLSRLEEGTFKPVVDSRNADERIREILSAEAPGRGLSKQEHWGLAQILWAPQGELHLQNISGNVSERLKAALGVQVSGESGNLIEEGISERFLEFFTRKGGYKGGKNAAPIIFMEEKRDKLSQELVSLRERQMAFEEASHRVEDARERRLQARREANALRETVAQTRTSAETYSRLHTEQSNKRETEAIAKEKYESLTNRQKQIQEIREQIESLNKFEKDQENKVADLKREESLAKEGLASSRTSREASRKKRSQLTEQEKLIDTARDYLQQTEHLTGLEKRLSQIAELSEQKQESQRRLEKMLAPSASTIRDLRQWIGKRDQAALALMASQIHLAITPDKEVEVKNATDDSTTKIKAGKTLEIAGDDWVDVSVTGFGSLRASGPGGSSEKHRADLIEANQEIGAITQPYGVDDPDKLQELREQADSLGKEIKGLQERINDLLDDALQEDLKQRQIELRARVDKIETQHSAWKNSPPVVSKMQSEFDLFKKGIEDAIAEAEDAFEKAQTNHATAGKVLNEAEADQKVIQGRMEIANRQLADLEADKLTDKQRNKAISDALMSWQAAKTAAEEAEKALKQFPDDPNKELGKLEKQLTALEETESRARDEEKTAEGQLQSLSAEGTYSKLVSAEEQLVEIESAIEAESIRMDAIKLLHETVGACKSRMVASVAAPVERSASRMLARIVGPRMGTLKLAENFVPSAVSPEIADDPVPLHNLSGGEQEQLFLVARLALADVLAKNQRQLVVLDDVLNATDSGRLARLLILLEEVSDRLQIIILTCHPERYRALDGAEFFELKN